MDIVSDAVIDQLARTKGWTRFFSVLMWIAVAFMVLAGIFFIGMGIMGGTALGNSAGSAEGILGGAIAGGFLGGVYIIMAAFYVYPALKMWKFSNQINELLLDPSEFNLVAALSEQRRFWKFVGIAMIVYLSFIVLAFGVAIIGGIMSASSGV